MEEAPLGESKKGFPLIRRRVTGVTHEKLKRKAKI